MRQIEERMTVIGPGAIVRLKKEATNRLADLMARWRVLGIEGEEIRVEDKEDSDDVRTFNLDQVERVSGGVEVTDSALALPRSANSLRYPEHNRWPACISGDTTLVEVLEGGDAVEYGSLFDRPDDEDEDE